MSITKILMLIGLGIVAILLLIFIVEVIRLSIKWNKQDKQWDKDDEEWAALQKQWDEEDNNKNY